MQETMGDVLGRVGTQAEFGELVGVSQQAVSELHGLGVLARGQPLGAWLLSYCARLREQAAARLSGADDRLDLVQERALLARAQRDAQELRNQQAVAEFAPTALLSDVLQLVSQAVAAQLQHLPRLVDARCPGLPDQARQAVDAVIASARQEWLRSTAALTAPDVGPPQEDDDLVG